MEKSNDGPILNMTMLDQAIEYEIMDHSMHP